MNKKGLIQAGSKNSIEIRLPNGYVYTEVDWESDPILSRNYVGVDKTFRYLRGYNGRN